MNSQLTHAVREQGQLTGQVSERPSLPHWSLGARKLEEPNRWLTAIMESSDDAIIGESLDGLITNWNSGATRIYGYSAKEALGRHASMLSLPDRVSETATMLESIKRGETVKDFQTTQVTKDGRRVQVSLITAPVRDRDGNVIGAATIGHDITKHKLLEEQCRQRTEWKR